MSRPRQFRFSEGRSKDISSHQQAWRQIIWILASLALLLGLAGSFHLMSLYWQGDVSPTNGRLLNRIPFLHPQDARLVAVLREAAMPPNNTVIITTFTAAWKDFLSMWLERLKVGRGTSKYLRHIFVLCMDEEGYEMCKEKPFLKCYYDSQADKEEREEFGGNAHDYGTKAMVHMMWRRLELLSKIIHFGFNILLTDIDVVWFKDPFPWLAGDTDMVFSCDKWFEDPREISPNGGFWFSRSNARTKAFFDYWLVDHETRFPESEPHMHEQEAFRQLRPERDNYTAQAIGLTLSYLPTTHFGSFCQSSYDAGELVTFHPICLVGKKAKMDALASVIRSHDRTVGSGTVEEERSPQPSFRALVEKAATPAKLVILTLFPPGHRQLMDLFVDRLMRGGGTNALLSRLLVLTFQKTDFEHCTDLGAHCYLERGVLEACGGGDNEGLRAVCMTKRRLEAARFILRCGVSVLYTDPSMIWLTDPLPLLEGHGRGKGEGEGEEDFRVGCLSEAGRGGQQRELQEGYWLARSNERTKQFLDFWIENHNLRLHPLTAVEDVDHETLRRIDPEANHYVAERIGLRMGLLESPHFVSLCQDLPSLARAMILGPSCLRRAKHGPSIKQVLEQAYALQKSRIATAEEAKRGLGLVSSSSDAREASSREAWRGGVPAEGEEGDASGEGLLDLTANEESSSQWAASGDEVPNEDEAPAEVVGEEVEGPSLSSSGDEGDTDSPLDEDAVLPSDLAMELQAGEDGAEPWPEGAIDQEAAEKLPGTPRRVAGRRDRWRSLARSVARVWTERSPRRAGTFQEPSTMDRLLDRRPTHGSSAARGLEERGVSAIPSVASPASLHSFEQSHEFRLHVCLSIARLRTNQATRRHLGEVLPSERREGASRNTVENSLPS